MTTPGELPPTAVVFDVDGVITPIGGATAWGDDVTIGDPQTGLNLSPSMCAALEQTHNDGHVGCYWLTDWTDAMRQDLDLLPGRSWPTIADPTDGPARARDWAADTWSTVSWWKWWALDEWLHQHREVRQVAWIDDRLRYHHGVADTSPPSVGRTWIGRRRVQAGTDVLLVAPDKRTGLTPGDLRIVTDWIHPVRG